MLSHTESTSTSPNQPHIWLVSQSRGFLRILLQEDSSSSTYSPPQVVLPVKNLPANAGDMRDAGSIPGLGRSPEGGHGKPLQNSCLGNSMDRRAWQASLGGGHKKSDMSDHTHVHAADMGEVLKTRASTLTGAQSLFLWHLMPPHLSSGKSHSKAKQLVFSSRWIHLNQPELQANWLRLQSQRYPSPKCLPNSFQIF